jgi:SAM-dependent methyltransferase
LDKSFFESDVAKRAYEVWLADPVRQRDFRATTSYLVSNLLAGLMTTSSEPVVIADFGCGSGEVGRDVAMRVAQALNRRVVLVGIDREAGVIDEFERRAGDLTGITQLAVVADMVSAKWAPNSLDAVIAVRSLEYLPGDELTSVLAEAGTALRPGGTLIIITKHRWGLAWRLFRFLSGLFRRNPIPKPTWRSKSDLVAIGFAQRDASLVAPRAPTMFNEVNDAFPFRKKTKPVLGWNWPHHVPVVESTLTQRLLSCHIGVSLVRE